MENETDESLVTYMGFFEEEHETAEAAVGELYRRHSKMMTAWCIRNFHLYHQSHEEMVQITFKKALMAAKRFTPLPKAKPDDEKTRYVKFWLYCILKNTCIDAQRSERFERRARVEVDVEQTAAVVLDPPDEAPAEAPSAHRVELIRQFMATLTPHDQAILYNTMQYYDRHTGQTIMPKPILEELIAELDMTKISLRTQRSRLLERMRLYVLENEQ